MKTILESYRAGLFQKKYWLQNIIAGVIVGVVALPLAMAFAIASGAKPEQGLYTAIVAGFIVSVMGGSRLQIAGPTGAFIVVLSGITAKYGVSGLQIATVLAGILLVFFGVTRLGSVIKFIPAPVIIGFTTGIAVVVWVGQWQYFFGLPSPGEGHFHEKLWHLLHSFPQLDYSTTTFGFFSLLLVLYSHRMPGFSRIPGPMVALVVATVLQSIFHFQSVATIGSLFGGIPEGLPGFSMPEITFDRVVELLGPALTVAMLGAIESLLSAVVADGMAGTRHDSNRELIGQGLANIVAPFFGGFAATGAIARTATNIRNGGNSPLAGVVHCLTLLLVIVCFAPLAVNVPLVALSAILFVVAWNMSEAPHFIKFIQVAPKGDVITLLVTFGLTVFVDLVVAVNVGVMIAVLHFMRSMAASVEVRQVDESKLSPSHLSQNVVALPDGVLVYEIQGPFFFGSVVLFQDNLAASDANLRHLIIHMRWMPYIDMTALHALEKLIVKMKTRGVQVILCGANPLVENKLRKAGIIDVLGESYWYSTLPKALASCHLPVTDAEDKTLFAVLEA